MANGMCMVCVLSQGSRPQGEERLKDVYRGGKKVDSASRSSGFWKGVRARIFGGQREVVGKGGGCGIEAEDWERDAVEEEEEEEGEEWIFIGDRGLITGIDEFGGC
jgi:hypothetical protein